MMKALAWDDEPKEYLDLLKRHLARHDIHLDVVEHQHAFAERLTEGGWDFVITDLVEEDFPTEGEQDPSPGLGIARRSASQVPIVFVITKHYGRSDLYSFGLPSNVIFKSKQLAPGWMADDIHQTLKQYGIVTDKQMVFLIYGSDNDSTRLLERYLFDLKLNVATSDKPESQVITIDEKSIESISTSGVCIALCTTDERLSGERSLPSPHVLAEIGLAYGVTRCNKKLIIIRKAGLDPVDLAWLPFRFDDVANVPVVLEYYHTVDETFTRLADELLRRGMLQST